MGYFERLWIGKEELNLLDELDMMLRPKKKKDLIKLAFKSLLAEHLKDNIRVLRIRNELKIEYDSLATLQIEKIRSLHSKRITIVKNTYRYVWEQFNHNYAKVNVFELLKNIDMQMEICKVNCWEYEENQLKIFHEVIEHAKDKENYLILNDIRVLLGR